MCESPRQAAERLQRWPGMFYTQWLFETQTRTEMKPKTESIKSFWVVSCPGHLWKKGSQPRKTTGQWIQPTEGSSTGSSISWWYEWTKAYCSRAKSWPIRRCNGRQGKCLNNVVVKDARKIELWNRNVMGASNRKPARFICLWHHRKSYRRLLFYQKFLYSLILQASCEGRLP